MNDFVQSENENRIGKYKKDTQIENFLKKINIDLHQCESYEKGFEELPNIFIFGLPRSGTTLTYQLVTNSLNVGFINNLMARFWLAPVSGIMLSRSIFGDTKDDTFVSDYGKSVQIYGPHEFAYFWHDCLKITSIEDMLDFSGYKESVDWENLHTVLLNMQQAFSGKPMVFKTNYVANFLEQFAETFKKSLFIYIKRDSLDVACSILEARKKYFGRTEEWWATYPENYDELKELPPYEQIVEQVLSLEKTYHDKIKQIDPERAIEISYEALCADPRSFINEIRTKVQALCNYDIAITSEIPETFTFKKKIELTMEEQKLRDLLQNKLRSL